MTFGGAVKCDNRMRVLVTSGKDTGYVRVLKSPVWTELGPVPAGHFRYIAPMKYSLVSA